MSPRLTVGLLTGVTLAALLLASCGEEIDPTGAGQANSPAATVEAIITPEPTQTSVPIDQNPTVPPGEPIVIEIESHFDQPVTPELLAEFSHLVVVGVVREQLASQWSTPDGSRPETILGRESSSNTIFTPVLIDLEQRPLMDLGGLSSEAESIIVLIEGGTIDEVTIRHTGSFYDLPVGARVVLGSTSTADPSVINMYGDVFNHMLPEGYDIAWLPQIRFIIADGVVVSDHERFPEDEFFARLNAALTQRSGQ